MIWVCEKVKAWQDLLAVKLFKDFAVRWLSAQQDIYQLLGQPHKHPRLLLLDSDSFAEQAPQLEAAISQSMLNSCKIYLSTKYPGQKEPFAGHACEPFPLLKLHRQISDFDLRGLIKHVLKQAERSKLGGGESAVLTYGNLVFDFEQMRMQLLPDGSYENLSLKEGRLLKLFMQQPQVCLPREHIKAVVWGNISVSPRTIDSQISRLRRRLEYSGLQIENIYGEGYIFQ